MSLYEGSEDIGIVPAKTPSFDRWHGQERPSTGTLTTATNRQGPVAIPYATLQNARLRVNNGLYDNVKIGRQDNGTYGITFNDGANDILLIGQDSNNNEVVKIAKSGFDAYDAPPDELIFSSLQDVLKVVDTGLVTVPTASASGPTGFGIATNSVPHDLNFTPLLFTMAGAGGSYGTVPLINILNATGGGSAIVITTFSVDAINVNCTTTVNIIGGGSGSTASGGSGAAIKFYLLQESAN